MTKVAKLNLFDSAAVSHYQFLPMWSPSYLVSSYDEIVDLIFLLGEIIAIHCGFSFGAIIPISISFFRHFKNYIDGDYQHDCNFCF